MAPLDGSAIPLTSIGDEGIAVVNSNGNVVTVSGNVISAVGTRGISIDTAANAIIRGNLVSGCNQEGILVQSSDGTVITGNNLSANSASATNTYSAIKCSSSTRLVVADNNINGTSAIKHKYGFEMDDASRSIEFKGNSMTSTANGYGTDWFNYAYGKGIGTISGIRKQFTGSTAPVTGTWSVGEDTIINTSPVPGGASGWVYTAQGTPGLWKGYGIIAP
ncbi:MAG TPA: hypothetical protein DCL60_02565 [Armatimonadetes bacterium]|jgi:parallel beta-helix repeat protein|nr:hypothetical protein [Armatimonadota bacterium]